jgi:protein-disulfide isomerase
MLDQEKQSVFSSLSAKTSFIFGLVAGFLIICAIGFFILLGIALSDDSSQNNQRAAGNLISPPAVQAPSPTPSVGERVDVVISDNDHIRGNKNAPVKIVEFSDYQCPFCKRHHPTMQQIMAEYGDQVAWIYKHYPLDSLHPQARPAAEASECIWEQKGDDGFWQFTDDIFANQARIGSDLYNELAGKIGVNMNQFQDCVDSRKYQSKVEADYQAGLKAGVTGTPGNFVNGIPVKGAVPFSSLKLVIDSELSK